MEAPKKSTTCPSQLSSNLEELKVNLWDYKGIVLPQKVKGYLPYY